MALRLHWSDERYVRIYCRDTIEWAALSWDAQALYVQINRKADRRGYIALGRVGRRGVAALLGRADLWCQVLEPALAELEADGCVRVEGDVLVIADFVEAQEAVSSGRARQAKYREGKRAGDEPSPDGDETSPSNEASQKVTPGYSTAETARHGTARPPDAQGPTLAGDELSRSFAAALDAEPTREDRLRARVLAALGDGWRTCADVASALKRSPHAVEDDLLALRRKGVVERAERGSPPVFHWRLVVLGSASGPASSGPELPPLPPLPSLDPTWLASLGERRSRAEALWGFAMERIAGPRSGVSLDRRADLLEQERAGLVARFTEGRTGLGDEERAVSGAPHEEGAWRS
jgi:hypothetical protein